MKVILKALSKPQSTTKIPQVGWWSFVENENLHLCRYGHIMVIFSKTEVLYSFSETRTDKTGVNFAIKNFYETINN